VGEQIRNLLQRSFGERHERDRARGILGVRVDAG
jgi:hypothetical protein